ncbi:MAG: amino acid permease, partial [Sulfobacillus sp.]
GLIAIGFGLFTLALSVVFPNAKTLGHSLVPQLVLGMRALGPLGFWWMVIVSLTTAMTTFNGGLATASRFIYALARERVLPPQMARLNKALVPQNALLTLSGLSLGLAILVYVTGQYLFLINAGAAVESFMYALTAIVVANLRRREPNTARIFRSWGVPWASWLIAIIFTGLGVGSLLAPSGEHGFPGPLVFLVLLTLLAQLYVWRVVPKLKAARRGGAKVAIRKS